MTMLDDGWILDCATGAAPDAVRVLAACQGAMAPRAAQRLAGVEAAFGAMLEREPGVALAPGALTRALDRLDDDAVAPVAHDPRPGLLPSPLARALEVQGDRRWRRRLGGYSEIVVESLCAPGVDARLISIPPGKGAPEHDHSGEELTLVLTGSFHDGRGAFARGDVCRVEPGDVHQPRVDSAQTCVCFVVELGQVRLTNKVYAGIDRISRLTRRF
ncbi:cupin domain-containing protein [Alkalicaulis satelles]|nr:cupin domain-containing protein [Alkalicaulis satelles]